MKKHIKFRGKEVETPKEIYKPEYKLPEFVKCMVCGKPPIGQDWLKPVSNDPNCWMFIHLSHIPNAPVLSEEAAYITRKTG